MEIKEIDLNHVAITKDGPRIGGYISSKTSQLDYDKYKEMKEKGKKGRRTELMTFILDIYEGKLIMRREEERKKRELEAVKRYREDSIFHRICDMTYSLANEGKH